MMDVLHMFYNFQGHVLHMFYNFRNDSKNNLNIKDMATFKTVALRQRADGFWNVSIRVTHNRKSRYLKTDKIVETKSVNKKNHEVKDPFVLEACTVKIAHFADMLNKQPIRTWSVDDVVAYLESGTADVCFSDYARQYHDNLYNNGHERNARNYELAYKHLELYAGSNKVMCSQLTSKFINGWIKSLAKTARAKEMYPICIRQIFRQALLEFNDYDCGIIRITTNPWLKIKIPKADTPEKRAITMEECRAFFAAPLPPSDRILPLAELGHDVAMMVLCLAGMNTVDIYNLKKEDYHDGIISYERAKTRKFRNDHAYMEMKIPGILQPVFDKYLDKTTSPYLFDFHKRMTNSDSFGANINCGIRQICEKSLHIPHEKAYCVYTFRHTWATVAQNECGASIDEVGFAMNHSDRHRVTRSYVKIDFSPAWALNEKVLEKIFFTEDKSRDYSKADSTVFERFSFRQMMKGSIFYRGRKVSEVTDVGFNNVDEIIGKLMKELPSTIPSRAMVLIKIENVDKGQTQTYSRMVE